MAAPARMSWLESEGGQRAGQGDCVDNTIDVHYGDNKCPNRGADKVLREFRRKRYDFWL